MEKKINTRRDFIKTTAIITAGIALVPGLACKPYNGTDKPQTSTYPTADGFVQDPLPYAYDALVPYIDAQTMEIHFSKHHAGYVKKLNGVVFAHKDMMNKSLEQLLQDVSKLPEDVREIIRNNGGGHWNHSFFWKMMTPANNNRPEGELKEAILKKWDSMEAFKTEFEETGKNRFGSGWTWLLKTDKGLEIVSTPNQDNPIMDLAETKGAPVLAVDVWEHAYYLKYQNERGEYLKNFWNVVNWKRANELYTV